MRGDGLERVPLKDRISIVVSEFCLLLVAIAAAAIIIVAVAVGGVCVTIADTVGWQCLRGLNSPDRGQDKQLL